MVVALRQEYKCIYKPLQEEITQFLKKEKIPLDNIAECRGEKLSTDECCPCSNLLKNLKTLYTLMPTERSAELLTLVYELFGSSEVISDHFSPDQYATQSFYCPEISSQFYQPCSISSCQFYTPNDWVKNCALVYFTKHGRGTLSYNELTFILDIPSNTLRAKLNGALRKLRSGALKNYIQRENSGGLFYRVMNPNVCPVCESRIPQRSSTKITKRKITYCSQACFDFKQPSILIVENEFSTVIEKLLQYCANYFTTVNLMSSALGLSRQLFITYCKRYGVQLPISE
jgi:hypothetical protein